MTAGIYGIECKVNKRIYIGKSLNIESRWSGHKAQLRKNKHHNVYLQADWNMYGEDEFAFEILDEIKITDENKYSVNSILEAVERELIFWCCKPLIFSKKPKRQLYNSDFHAYVIPEKGER